MPKIDVARLNALRPKPRPSENPLETVRTPSDDGEESMEIDKVPLGKTLRKRKGNVEKHLRRGANDKEKESFRKRVFRIPIDKPFEDAYYTHKLWMFFRETKEKEEEIRRMFCEAREKMRKIITLKKRSDPGQFAIPCTVKGIEFPHTLCDTGASYDPIPVKKSQTLSRQINDPGIIAACHCGVEYETDYSADDFWQVAKEEKLQEGDFEVESLMSFGVSHWCRLTSDHAQPRQRTNRSTNPSPNRSIGSPEHRSMTPTESSASCNAVRIQTHEEFEEKHPNPPNPDNMPKIDVARLNALRPKPRPSENPPETVRTPSDDGEESMEIDKVPLGKTLRKRKGNVEKHLRRGAKDKEKESFRKRVFRIPIDKPFEDAYYTHKLWMFFRETKEKEEDIRRMFREAREKMRKIITLKKKKKKKSDPGQFAIPCTYDPIPVKKSQTLSRQINDPGIIAACHCGVEYETDYSASIETHTATSIDSCH
ncbi:hypothetical protein F2Q68_00016721 [Brassica cretica]|uniref:Uncharacterized protein n=1 Tax=Brassica cretica TaxID=69181 RepID=A0A8S9HN29_BRACR|nr:hypothetical protein F2Q68_00016721 [Brassica cretica]